MTFAELEPAYRDDEAPARFTGRRYTDRVAEHPFHRFAACERCLGEGEAPYLRALWLIGWIAVCTRHGSILIERCSACRTSLRITLFGRSTSFSPVTCIRCGSNLLEGSARPAHPAAVRMQASLLAAKYDGAIELEGLGAVNWKEFVALVDVLLGTFWTDLTLAEREGVFLLYAAGPPHQPSVDGAIFDCRHASLVFLAWLLEGWPNSAGAQMSRELLMRWWTADRNRLCRHLGLPPGDSWTVGPNNFDPAITARLRTIADALEG